MLTSSPQDEYWFHVSSLYDIPIAGNVDKVIDIQSFKKLLEEVPVDKDLTEQDIVSLIHLLPDSIDTLRALVGISDKRMYLDLSYLFYKTPSVLDPNLNVLGCSFYELNRHPLSFFKSKIGRGEIQEQALLIISKYLLSNGVLDVIQCLRAIGVDQSLLLLDRLINEKEAQQKLTKRRGHGAEQCLASFVHALPLSYEPSNKHTNPMARDPNVDRKHFSIQPTKGKNTWAFDLILKEERDSYPRIFIQSLIHTSDPGQYGVNKSDETVLIKESLNLANQSDRRERELWGLLDGVGFSENKSNTIDKMLSEFDQFLQLKTLYKVALRLHRIGVIKVKDVIYSEFYTEDEARQMHNKYADSNIDFFYNLSVPSSHIKGGEAAVSLL